MVFQITKNTIKVHKLEFGDRQLSAKSGRSDSVTNQALLALPSPGLMTLWQLSLPGHA